jgi:outer membrane murein-binding lipoprotein Lpp
MVSSRVGENRCVRVAVILVVLLLAGCGVPQELSKQAEEVHSVAAEGALLSHEASEGSLDSFTREHAQALRKLLGQLRPAIEDDRLAHTSDAVDAALADLAEHPGDRTNASRVERRLDDAAKAADELAG